MESVTNIKVKCSNCGKIIVERNIIDRIPNKDDYIAIGSIEIRANHQSSVGITKDIGFAVKEKLVGVTKSIGSTVSGFFKLPFKKS